MAGFYFTYSAPGQAPQAKRSTRDRVIGAPQLPRRYALRSRADLR